VRFLDSRDRHTAQDWRDLQKFAAECRRLWPGAKIAIRPNEFYEFAQSARTPAGASGNRTEETEQ
jgi:hypothetical protein